MAAFVNNLIKLEQVTRIQGSKSFAAGKTYQTHICEKLNRLQLGGIRCNAVEVDGAKAGADISLISHLNVGIETKNKGAFEGGCKKMTYNTETRRLEIVENSIHKIILGDAIIYEGRNLPWYEGKKSLEDWQQVKALFSKDIYLAATNDAISDYYRTSGVAYIQIENKGLYHTGADPLKLEVPYFSCEIKLRIRSTKHKKKGISSDVTAALQYNKRLLIKSPFSLDDNGQLPPNMNYAIMN